MKRRCTLLLVFISWLLYGQQPWVKKGRILAPGFAGTRSSNLLSAPSVVKLKDGRLRLYFWTRDGEGHPSTEKGRALVNFIYAAEASPDDPMSWKLLKPDPLLSPNPLGKINDRGPGFPYVLRRDDGPWLLFYCTWGSWAPPGQISNRTALAVSHDEGITWSVMKEPLLALGEPGQWDAALTGSVSVLRTAPRKYQMWYTAGDYGPYDNGTRNLIAQIGHATSPDGLNWTKTRSPNPVLSARKNEIPRFEAVISKPCVVLLGRTYHMWYSRRVNDGRGYRLAYARSSDGIRWQRVLDDNVIPYSADGFDSQNLSYPNVIEMGDELWMFYVGNQFGATGIGLATMKKSAVP